MPLAHILAPQLARKAEEIAAQISEIPQPPPSVRPGSRGMGYLSNAQAPDPQADAAVKAGMSADRALGRQGGDAFYNGMMQGMYPPAQPAAGNPATNAGGRRVPEFPVTEKYSVPEGLIGQSLMTQVPARDIKPTLGYLGKLAGGKFANGMNLGAAKQNIRIAAAGGNLALAEPSVAPMAAAERKLAEQPAKVEAKTDKKGRIIIQVPDGAVGVAEDGQYVDKKGKKIGYLTDQAMRSAPREKPEINPSGKQHETIRI